MGFLAACCAALIFALTLAVLDAPLSAYRAKARRVRRVAEAGTQRFEDFEGSLFDRLLGPVLLKLKQRAAMQRAKRGGKGGKRSAAEEKLERQLRTAGIYMEPASFTLIKLGALIVSPLAVLLLTSRGALETQIRMLLVLGAAILGMLIPSYAVKFIGRARQKSMRKQLPDMMDILSVSIDAGLGFDAALKRALDKFKGALKEEMTVASMEISMGKARRDALADMAERTDITELRILVAAIVQSEQMGTPIKNVLKAQSAQLRATRKQAAQEKGMKAPVKMMLPMVGFIFPVLLIILMGPTVMNIVEIFK